LEIGIGIRVPELARALMWHARDADNSKRFYRDAGITVSRREEIARPVRKHRYSPACWHRQTRRVV
jgi:hypothetical protein